MVIDGMERLCVDETDEDSHDVIYNGIISELVSRKKTFAEVVEGLETPLTSTDLSKHIRGLNVLLRILTILPKDFLSSSELEFISQFFCGQVKQHHSFTSAAVNAMYTLVQIPQLSKESLHNIVSTLFNHVVWQTQTLPDRKVFYQLLQYLVFNRINDFSSISSEFLLNVISSVDGERDPRNLLLLFSFLPRLYSTIPLGPLVEDAFEVVSCYFPIDFNPSATDPGVVTKQDLVSAITPCLLAVPDFAPFCIALIQDKLESSLKSAKIDSYKLLVEGCKSWPGDCVTSYADAFWLIIKQDTLPPRDMQVAESAILALQALVTVLPNPSQSSLLLSVLRSCEGYLSNVQLSLFEPSCQLLLAGMAGSPSACTFLFGKLLPGFISLLEVTQDSSKASVVNKLISFVEVGLQNNINFNSGTGCDRLFGTLRACTETGVSEVRQSAYTALTLLSSHLDAECRANLYPCLLTQVTTPQSPTVRLASLRCLQKLSLTYGDEVRTNIVLALCKDDKEDLILKQLKFETICSLAVVETFHQTLECQFVSLVSHNSACGSVAISCLRNCLEDKEVQNNNKLVNFLFCKSSVLSTLIRMNAYGEDLVNCTKVIRILVRLQTSSEQTRVVEPLVKDLLKLPNDTKQLVLLESLISPLWPEVKIMSLEEISQVIIPAVLKPLDSSSFPKAALQLLSSLINKSNNDDLLDLVSQQLKQYPPVTTTTAHAYITKALVLRNHPLMEHWINKLVDLLDNDEVGEIVAEGVQLIVEESEDCLNIQNHCNVRLLYRQRLFHLVVPRLVSASTVQHLKAMAYLLQAVPHTVYTSYIKQITPFLVRSLDTDCEALLCTVLHTLVNLLSTNHSLLEDHIDTFIPRFLNLSRNKQSMRVRIAALQCLSNTLKFSPTLLLPHKRQVIAELAYCLDDNKRLVRKEAARTRAKWFLLGAPTSDS